MLLKQKSPSLPRDLDLRTFGELLNSVIKRGKYAIPALFNGLEVLPSSSDKAKLFAKIFFLRTLILMTLVPLYLISLLELI